MSENPISYYLSDIRIQISNLIPTIKIISHTAVKSKYGQATKGYSSLLKPQPQLPMITGPPAGDEYSNHELHDLPSLTQQGEYAHLPISPQSSTASDFSSSQMSRGSPPDPDDILMEMHALRNKRSLSPPPPPPPLPVESMSRVPSQQDMRKYSSNHNMVIDLDEGSVATDSMTENPSYEHIYSLMNNRGVAPNTTVKELPLDDDALHMNLTNSNSASTLATTPAVNAITSNNSNSKLISNKVASKLPWRKPPDIQPRLKRTMTTVSLKDRSISPPSRSMDRSALLASNALSPAAQKPPKPPMKSPEEKAKDRQLRENKKLVNKRNDTLNKYYAFQQRELDKLNPKDERQDIVQGESKPDDHHNANPNIDHVPVSHSEEIRKKPLSSSGNSLDGNQSEISDHPSLSHNNSILNKSSNLMFTYSQDDPDTLHAIDDHPYDPFHQLHHVLDSAHQTELDDEVNHVLGHLAQMNVIPNLVPVHLPVNHVDESFQSADVPLQEEAPTGSRWMSPLLKGRLKATNGPYSPVAFGVASRGNDNNVPPLRDESPSRVPRSSVMNYSMISKKTPSIPERKPSPTKSTALFLQHQEKKKAIESKKQQQREYSFAKSPLQSRPIHLKEKTPQATPKPIASTSKVAPKADISIYHEPSSNRLYYGNKSFSFNTSRMANIMLGQHASKTSSKMGVSELGDMSQDNMQDTSAVSIAVDEKEHIQTSAYKKLLQFNEMVATRALQNSTSKSNGKEYYELTYGFLRNLESADDMLKYSHQINSLYDDLLDRSTTGGPHDKDYLISDYYELVKRRAMIMKYIQETFPVPPPPPSAPLPIAASQPASQNTHKDEALSRPLSASNSAPTSRPMTPTLISGINIIKPEDLVMPESIKLSEAIEDIKENQIKSLSSLNSIHANNPPSLPSTKLKEEPNSTPSTTDIVNAINELRMKQMQSLHQLKSQKSTNSLPSSQQ